MQNVDNHVSTLDSQVVRVLDSFNFSDSPAAWGNELNQILSDIYTSVVRKTKEDTRVAARRFRTRYRTAGLVHNVQEFAHRTSMIRLMLVTVDLLTYGPSPIPLLEAQERSRIRMDMPDLHTSVRSMSTRFSCWQDDVEDGLVVFSALEAPEQTLEGLLVSLSDTIPHTFLREGKDLIDQLVRLWIERRSIADGATGLAPDSPQFQQLVHRLNNQYGEQELVIRSFAGLITQIVNVPPFRILERDFTSRQLIEADLLYRRLCVRRANLNQEISNLEGTLDRMIDVVGAEHE